MSDVPPPPPPSYGQQPPPPGYAAYGGPATRSHPQGTLILVFGIVGLITCLPLAIAAWIMGQRALKQIDGDTGVTYTNRGQVNAGRICGMIGVILAVVTWVIYLATR